MQEKRGIQQRRNGVDVADQRDGLRGKPLQPGKIQKIGKAGVAQTDQGDVRQIRAQGTGQARREQDVDQHDDEGGVQLDRRCLKAGRADDALVEDDQRGVKQRRQDRDNKTGHAQPAEGDAAADAHQTDGHETKGGDLRARQLLLEQNGREQQHQHRTGVIDQRGKADVQHAEGLEQRDPVRPERRPADQERERVGTHGRAVKAAAQQHQQRQKRAAEQRAQQHDLARRQGDVRDEQPVGAEDQHRQRIRSVGQKAGRSAGKPLIRSFHAALHLSFFFSHVNTAPRAFASPGLQDHFFCRMSSVWCDAPIRSCRSQTER